MSALLSASQGVRDWDGFTVRVPSQNFDFIAGLKESVTRDNNDLPCDDLFSPSPLTTPETSPDSSPTSTPHLPPVDLPIFENESINKGTPSESIAELTPAQKRRNRNVLQGRENRKKRRLEVKQKQKSGPPPRKQAEEKYKQEAAPVYTSAYVEGANVASAGYTGLNKSFEPQELPTADELLARGFTLQKWEGQ